MTRKEAYALIKKYGLQEEVTKVSGKNFTQTSTDVLEEVIWNYDCTLTPEALNEAEVPSESSEVEEAKEPKIAYEITDAYEAACLTFLAILKDGGELEKLLAKL